MNVRAIVDEEQQLERFCFMFRKLRNENINGVYFTENEVCKKLHTVMKEYFDFDIHLSPEWFMPYVKIRSFSECTAED